MNRAVTNFAWWLFFGLLAVLIVFAQLDRQSRYAPQFAGFVPDSLRYFGQAHVASAAIRQGSPEVAILEARKLISRRPLSAENLAILAAAQSQDGASTSALGTIQLAGRRGWREQGVQTSMLEISIASGDGQEAARRFAALFALNGVNEQIEAVAPRVFAITGAREELSRILASNPRWKDQYLRALTTLRHETDDDQ